MRFGSVLILAFLAACGSEKDGGGKKADAPKEGDPESEKPTYHSMLVATTAELPACTPEAEGWLVYVQAESAFKACLSGQWTPISIKGEKGDPGPPGPKGDSATTSTESGSSPTGTKLRKGMTKAEVEAAIGSPKSVESYSSFTIWRLDDSKCGSGVCSLEFTLEGLLDKVSGVKPELIDLATF